jgi:hypothetical protein
VAVRPFRCPFLSSFAERPSSTLHPPHRVKNLLTYLALIGFASVSVVSVVRAVRTELRRGPAFDEARLGAWLVAPSNPEESIVTLRRAAWRLERELYGQFDRRKEYQSLDKSKRRTYEFNWQRLLVTLVRRHAAAFAATPEALRDAFVNERLAQYATWYAFDDGTKLSAADFLLLSNVDRRMGEFGIEPAERERIREFAKAMQAGAIKRTWGRLFGSGGNGPPREP